MNQVERLYKIEQLLGEAHTVPITAMLERLEISRATFKRDLATLRDRLNAPIVWDRFGGGYRFEPQRRAGAKQAGQAGPKHAGPKHPGPKHPRPTHQRPGLWFNSSEAYALLAMQQSSRKSTPASWPARSNHWRCACARCSAAAATTSPRSRSASSSCRWAHGAPTRNTSATSPAPCSPGAPITNRQIHYTSRGSGEATDRLISPQRLVNTERALEAHRVGR